MARGPSRKLARPTARARPAAAPSGRSSDRTEPLALYRVAAQLPRDSWGYQFSLDRPNLRLELMNRIELGDGLLLAEVRMVGEGADEWPAAARTQPTVVKVEAYPESERNVLYRVIFKVPSIHTVTQRHRVLTRYPIVIQNGWSRFETFAGSGQMRDFLADLEARVGPGHVESVRRNEMALGKLGLTPAQDSVFREALSTGYFSVPRGISVSDLADRLGRSKSTVSVALSKIQNRLADTALQLDLASFQLAP